MKIGNFWKLLNRARKICAIALLYPRPPPPPPPPSPIAIDDSSLKNAAESFTVALTLGGYESAIAPKDYDVDMFITEMREYPCIWNTSLRSYHDQIIRKNV